MYKLVCIAGKIRGTEFTLKNGENILGRDSGCDLHTPVQGISKKHVSITVTDDVAYLKDLESANGTFLNGKIVKRGTVKNGDKIALPDTILQVVYVAEKKIIVKKRVSDEEEEEDEEVYLTGGEAPASIPGKLLHLFKYKFMNAIHGINEEYEWRILFGIILTIFLVVIITLTIFPVLQNSKDMLMGEIAKRGAHFADEISRMNSRALEQKLLDQVNAKFLKTEEGVVYFDLFDFEGRIVRPVERMNEYISDPFSVEAKEYASKQRKGNDTFAKPLPGGEIGIGKKIMAFNPKRAEMEAVGVIAIRFKPKTLIVEAAKSTKLYMEALVTAAIAAIIFFGIIYYLTLRPIEEMKYQIEEALRGKRKNVDSRYLFNELAILKNAVNSMLSRIRELGSEEGDAEFDQLEEDTPYVDTLKEFLRGAGVPGMVLNSEKAVAAINLEAEDLTGIRESSSEGENLLDVSREQGFAATVIELCDNSANANGTSQDGEYELGGFPHRVYVTSLMGKDNFAKSFYITFIKDE
ncbi:MAG: FHA domain-containing protein [Halobacteriovoraceae bacterium]|jgi:pSer/pThr/pTyr-binding forkhead associated (FHA) protein|nr:FHA domain-containing protein [Halobacteriovoraceae bacterium]MBT5092775.1 FHA domain-containing protein [Halobacteriovoraceae bacterium]